MKFTIQTSKAQVEITLEAQQDFVGCLLTGVLAALPAFLEAFMNCLAGGGNGGSGFRPGDRTRCD